MLSSAERPAPFVRRSFGIVMDLYFSSRTDGLSKLRNSLNLLSGNTVQRHLSHGDVAWPRTGPSRIVQNS